MARYKLHVNETISVVSFIEIETSLSEREVDELLIEIEKEEIKSALYLNRKLESEGIKIKSFSLGNAPCYMKAETLEIEEIERAIKDTVQSSPR